MDELSSEILKKLTSVCSFPELFHETEPIKGNIYNAPPSKIAHIRADYDGWRWWNTIWPCHDELATPEIKREIDTVYEALTAKETFYDLAALTRFCESHPEACVGEQRTEYNFYLEGKLCDYWLRLITRRRDYNIYLNAYVKRSTKENA